MSRAWARLGLRGRLALSIAAVVVLAYAVVFAAVRGQMAREQNLIKQGEAHEREQRRGRGEQREAFQIPPIRDAQDDVEKTFFLVGGLSLLAALAAGYLLAARTASPLRRFAATAAEVDAGDLTPRLDESRDYAVELRVLAESFNHMLDRLDRAFGRQRQFVSDASHELRTPLTAIRGQLEVLARQESPSPEEVRRVEAVALAEMRRVERLVEEMLTLAGFDEGAGIVPRPVDVGPFLREQGARDGVEIGEIPAGTARFDRELISRVVGNLIANARRHAGPGGAVRLSGSWEGGALVIAVDDDGPGIPPAERQRVFDRFHRSEPGRGRGSGGSGLGLAIARSIVAAHGGAIWVEDSPLGGARVAFRLPARPETIRDLSSGA